MTVTPDFWPDLRAFVLVVTGPLLVLGWYYARAVRRERNDKEK